MNPVREQTRTRQHGTKNHTTNGDPAAKLAALREIVERKQYAKIDGAMVDLFSASAIVKVYDALSEANREKFAALPVVTMAKIAFKLLS